MKLLEEAESSSSEVEEDASATALTMSGKGWLGRRGSRRPGLTFAQQMGLIAARASEQHQSSLTIVHDSAWESTTVQQKGEEQIHSASWLSASSAIAPRLDDLRNNAATSETSFGNAGALGASNNTTTESNPFLDEKDAVSAQAAFASASTKSYGLLRKSASGTLLDPVDIVAASPTSSGTQKRDYPPTIRRSGAKFASTFVPDEHTAQASTGVYIEEDGSETEQEENGADEEEDDSPYLIEDGEDIGRHSEAQDTGLNLQSADEDHDAHTDDAFDQHSDSSELSELGEDDEEGDEELETYKELSAVDEGRSTSGYTSSEAKGSQPPSITRYLSASKSSGSSSLSSGIGNAQAESSTVLSTRASPKPSRTNNRERKSWGKPTVGDVNENPFLAPIAKSSKFAAADTGGSWLRTDNARMQKREGEKPTIDYVL
jgi:hypothetical protein